MSKNQFAVCAYTSLKSGLGLWRHLLRFKSWLHHWYWVKDWIWDSVFSSAKWGYSYLLHRIIVRLKWDHVWNEELEIQAWPQLARPEHGGPSGDSQHLPMPGYTWLSPLSYVSTWSLWTCHHSLIQTSNICWANTMCQAQGAMWVCN